MADLRKKFPVEFEMGGDDAIADRLGLSRPTLRKWASSDEDLAAFQLTNALLKARDRAIADAQIDTIKPLVEFYKIVCTDSRHGARQEILPSAGSCGKQHLGVREELEARHGIYIFYDSRGCALYAGKARKQTLWREMNLAFNRARDEVQSIMLVTHPTREQKFRPAYEHPRQPKESLRKLHELASYFSAYWVLDGMIDDLEAFIVRGFANDLLNTRMEKFEHSTKVTTS